jgi:hypothetical protein
MHIGRLFKARLSEGLIELQRTHASLSERYAC